MMLADKAEYNSPVGKGEMGLLLLLVGELLGTEKVAR